MRKSSRVNFAEALGDHCRLLLGRPVPDMMSKLAASPMQRWFFHSETDLPETMPHLPENRRHRGRAEQIRFWWQLGAAVVVFGIVAWQAWQQRQAELARQPASPEQAAERATGKGRNGDGASVTVNDPEGSAAETAASQPDQQNPTEPPATVDSKVARTNTDTASRTEKSRTNPSPPTPKHPGSSSRPPPSNSSPRPDSDHPQKASSATPQDPRIVVRSVTIRDLDGNVAYKGDVDLTDSLRRIDAGQRIERFRNDGVVFQNREGRLPKRPAGVYHEWVHPTPRLNGPGPQRIITGDNRDAWYTADHYKSFKKIR